MARARSMNAGPVGTREAPPSASFLGLAVVTLRESRPQATLPAVWYQTRDTRSIAGARQKALVCGPGVC